MATSRSAPLSGGLVLVLPELSPDSATHYAHYLQLIRELSSLTRVALVVERADPANQRRLTELLPGVCVRVQRQRAPARRAAELARLIVALGRQGYTYAYGSYSPYYGVAGALAGRFCGTTISYWHCRSDFFDRQISRRRTAKRLLTDTVPFLLSLHLSHRVITGTCQRSLNFPTSDHWNSPPPETAVRSWLSFSRCPRIR